MVSWRHCIVGLLAGEALLLVVSNVGLGVANATFGSAPDGGIVGMASLLSVMAGAYLAARLAGRDGMWQGIVVAIGFIAVGAVFQFLQEANIVHSALAAGAHQLVDLGPMNMGAVFSGDLLALFGGTFGGLMSRRGPSVPVEPQR